MDELVLRKIMINLKGKDYINFATTCKKYREEFYDKYMIKIILKKCNFKIVSRKSMKKIKHLHIDGFCKYGQNINSRIEWIQNLINEAKELQTLILGSVSIKNIDNLKHLKKLEYRGFVYDMELPKLPTSLRILRLSEDFDGTIILKFILEKTLPNLEKLIIRKDYAYMDDLIEILENEYEILDDCDKWWEKVFRLK